MGRKRSYTPLNVFLNTRCVGQLIRESSGAIGFTYDQNWLAWEHRMPVSLSLPLRPDRYMGAPVIALFDNLLPDYETSRRRVAKHVGAEGIDAFSLLSKIGRDCAGALQFLPDGESPGPTGVLTGEPLSEEQIASTLKNLEMTPLGIRKERNFRISVAGGQEKTALLFKDGQWLEPTGTTPTTHILKPQIGILPNGIDLSDSVENEYFCLKIMEGFGLRAAQAHIARFGDQKALVVKRFDRRWTADGRLIRLPQEDCCQALSVPPTRKYQNEGGPGIVEIMNLLRRSDDPARDRLDFFKATVLFWLVGAAYGHAKNFSLGLLPGGRFRMTPLYDVLTVQPNFDARKISQRDYRLAMRTGKSNHDKVTNILGRHFKETGDQSGLSAKWISDLFDEIRASAERALNTTIAALPDDFPEPIAESTSAAIRKRMLLM